MTVKWLLVLAGLGATAARAEGWNFAFNQGVSEYSTGSFADDGNSVALSCTEAGIAPGRVGVSVRRAGFVPAAQTPVVFTAAGQSVTMYADAAGSVTYPSIGVAPRFRKLWQMVRKGSDLKIGFGPGAPMVFSLAGAGKLLGPVPCPKQLAGR